MKESMRILQTVVKPFMSICSSDDERWWTKLGYFFGFLGSGTDCRCCQGTRIVLALIYGTVAGLSALISKWLAVGLIAGILFALLTVFAVQTMIEIEEEEDE